MRKIILFMTLALAGLSMMASPVDPDKARQVAVHFVAQHTKDVGQLSATLVYTHPMPKSGRPAMYAFNVSNKGRDCAFVLVSADDLAHPVLGYSYTRPWPTSEETMQLPSQVVGFLDDLAAQMEAAIDANEEFHSPDNDDADDGGISREWQQLMSPTPSFTTESLPDSVGPLLTTTWNQAPYYNALCPEDVNGPDGHAVTGCVATAMAQIINYWGYPIHGRGTHRYTHDTYGTLTVNYDSATYDYANMPTELTSSSTPAQINAVATLMRDCGVATNMIYGPDGSGTYTHEIRAALVNHFRYSPNLAEAHRPYYTDREWFVLLRNSIDIRQPIIYSGVTTALIGGGGHTFILDGYKRDDYFHFNFGWSGYLDGWYTLTPVSNDLGSEYGRGYGYIYNQTAYLGIMPDSTSEIYYSQHGAVITVDSPIEMYNINGNNRCRGAYQDYQYSNYTDTIVLISRDSTRHLTLEIIDFQNRRPAWTIEQLSIYDGLTTDSLLRRLSRDDQDTNNLSPVATSHNSMALTYTTELYRDGFHIKVSQEDGCPMVSNVSADLDVDSIRIEWQENGDATQWRVEYGSQGFTHGEGTTLLVDTNNVVIYDTFGHYSYEFHIQPACDTIDNNHIYPLMVNNRVYWIDMVTSEPEGYVLDSLGTIHIYSQEALAWLVKTVHHLLYNDYYGLLNYVSNNISIENDIDLSGYLWSPIEYWRGNLYGNGHVIKNMHIEGEMSAQGLFRETDMDTIIDIGFENARIYDHGMCDMMGTIVGLCQGSTKIINCYSVGYLVATESGSYAGGLVGGGGSFYNCYSIGYPYSEYATGGIVGGMGDTMSNCYTSINDNYGFGGVNGFTGKLCGMAEGGLFENCFADIDHLDPEIRAFLLGSSVFFIGGYSNTIIRNLSGFSREENTFAHTVPDSISYNYIYNGSIDMLTVLNNWVIEANSPDMRIWVWDSLTGLPVLGDYYEVTCPNVSNITAANVQLQDGYGLALSWQENGTAEEWKIKCLPHGFTNDDSAMFFTSNTTHDTLAGLVQGKVYDIYVRPVCDGDTLEHWGTSITHQFDKIYWTDVVTSCPEGYVEEVNGDVNISSAEGLAWLSVCTNGLHGQPANNYEGKTVHIVNNIDLGLYKWRPIGWQKDGYNNHWFSGTLSGHNLTIRNIYCNEYNRQNIGLIGHAFLSTIRDINIENTYIKGKDNIGALAGKTGNSHINNCHVKGDTIIGESSLGGLIGLSYYYGHYDLDSTHRSEFYNLSASGVIHVDGTGGVGGLIGEVTYSGKIMNCYAGIATRRYSYTGALVGATDNTHIENCYTKGHVLEPDTARLLIGYMEGGLLNHVYYVPSDAYASYINAPVSNVSAIVNNTLTTPITIDSIEYTDILSALNAWVDTYDTLGVFRHWAADSTGENDGFPVFNAINFYTLTLDVADGTPYGTIKGGGIYNSQEPDATIFATPNNGYHFSRWNDGNTENPRIIHLTQDTAFTAFFEKNMHAIMGSTNAIDHFSDFEANSNDAQWILLNGNYTNRWHIASLEDSNRALFISNDGGYNNVYSYNNDEHGVAYSRVFAYTEVFLTAGNYNYNYNWHGYGEVSWDYMRVALLPPSYELNTDDWTTWSCRYSLPNNAISMDGNTRLEGHTDWTNTNGGITISEDGLYRLLFFWCNDGSAGALPPAAVDNISIQRVSGVDYSNRGHVLGSDTVPYLDTVTLTAVPNSGYRFSHWSDNSTENPRTVVADRDRYLIATFEACPENNTIDTVIACNNYTWRGTEYTTSTMVSDTLSATNGCDSIVSLKLTVNHSNTGIETVTACDTYTWHGDTYTASTTTPTFTSTNTVGCDSVTTLHLTINYSNTGTEAITACDNYTWHNNTYTASTTTPTYTSTNTVGCDSVTTLHLTINYSNAATEAITACDNYTWHNNTYTASTTTPTYTSTNTVGCDSVTTLHLTINYSNTGTETVTACDTYTWHGVTYTASTTTPTVTSTNAVGCDSVTTLHLTINYSNTATETVTACDTYTWHGTAYTASTTTPTFISTNAVGCDSVTTLHLTVNYSNTATETVTACDNYTWHGNAYTASTTTPTFTSTNAIGCDSVTTLHLTINYSNTATETVTACDTYTWHGTAYTTSTTTPTFTSTNTVGCDSVTTLHLTINYSNTGTEAITACDNYTWHNNTYTASTTTPTFTSTNTVGCDSVTTLHLTINYSNTGTETITACDTYTWHGTAYTTSTTTPTFTSTNIVGCDSVTTLHLTINYSNTATETITACDTYTWHGNAYTASTTTPTFTTTNTVGCDSVTTLYLTINYSNTGTEAITACDNHTWHGNTYAASTTTPTFTSTNTVGCDSVTTLHLTINYSNTGTEAITACDNYTWHNNTYTASTDTPIHTSTNAVGCDSITTLHLTINYSNTGTESITACDNYTWHNNTYTASTTTPTFTSTNTVGCDSVTTLHLTINFSNIATETVTACDTYTWHNNIYTASTNTPTFTSTNAMGCDSVTTLHLTINYSNTATETVTACDTYTWHGTAYTASTTTPTFISTNAVGCDSVTTLHLTINYSNIATETVTACDTYTWHNNTYTATTTPTFISTNAVGCDSVTTLHLSINYSNTGTEAITACDNYTWHNNTYTASTTTPTFTSTNAVGCDSITTLHLSINYSNTATETITACDNYTWHNSTYTASTTTPTFTSTNAVGCDSVTTLHLTINYSNNATETVTACDTYTWHNNIYTASTNTPTFTSTNAMGCDSVTTLHLTINYSNIATETVTACDTYTWHNNTYTATTTTPTFISTNAVGCDSVTTLHLSINYSNTATETVTACDNYTWHNSTYTASTTTPTFTSTNTVGCDSVTTLHLTINYSNTGTETITACDNYIWHGDTYTTSTTTPTFTSTNAVGCDSVTTLHLTINYSNTATETITVCDSLIWQNNTYSQGGIFTSVLTNIAGCDSTVTLHLTINYSNSGIETLTTCDSLTWHSNVYTASTTTPTFTTLNAAGCDSVTTLHLTVNYSNTATEAHTVCDSLTWHGNVYTASTSTPTFTTLNASGCDSVTTLHLTVNYSNTGTETLTTCDSLTWHGITYTASTNTPIYTTLNAVGCDSVTTLHLTVNYSNTGDTFAVACDTFTWWNTDFTNSTDSATHVLNNAVGCDSTVTLHLTVNYSNTGDTFAVACDTFSWWNTDFTNSTDSATHVLSNAVGCDSTVTLHLTVNYSNTGDTFAVACDTFSWWNTDYTNSTDSATHVLNNAAGCDSTVTLHLTVNYSATSTVYDTATNSYTWHDSVYTESGTYLWQGLTDEGCDSTVTLILFINSEETIISPDGLKVKIHPNPTTGWITIDADDVMKVEVFDIVGRPVASHVNTNHFNLAGLPSGSYTLKIHLIRGVLTQRVLLK